MFRPAPAAKPDHDVIEPLEPLVPLSVIQLDLDGPAEGWASYLASRDIAVVLDDIGRLSISRDAARQLFDERREAEARKAEMRAESEKRAVEADRQWRSQLPRGVPWYEVPDGVLPVVAMTAADRAAQPKRTSVLQEALANSGGMTYHSLAQTDEDAS
jgi:hypothetical protein